MNNFLSKNTPEYKVLRTLVQAVISVLVIDGGSYLLAIVGHLPIPDWIKPILFGVLMAVLTAAMAKSGKDETLEDKPELPEGYFEKGENDVE